MKEVELHNRAVAALTETLEQVPFAKVIEVKEPEGLLRAHAGSEIDVMVADGKTLILIEFKKSGEPRVAREAANEFLRHRSAFPNVYPVFMAPYISPKSAEICREAGIGYADLAGNCYLSFGNVYIEREGRPNVFSERRGLRSLYSPKAERVLRVLLQNVHEQWKLQALADQAKVSLGQVHKVKTLLADREWLRTTETGIALSNPTAVLAQWVENYSYSKNRIRQYYSLKQVREIEEGIAMIAKERKHRYALAGFSAAERLAPFVRYQRASVYIEPQALPTVVQSLGLKEVTSGSNITLWAPYDDGVFYGAEERSGATVTSPIQTYLDLYGNPARGREAAEFLLEKVVKPKW